MKLKEGIQGSMIPTLTGQMRRAALESIEFSSNKLYEATGICFSLLMLIQK